MDIQSTFLRRHLGKLVACAAILLLPVGASAQLTVTVGSGSSSGSADGPIYRSASSSSFDYSSYHYLFTQSELSNAGLIPGVALTNIAWYKTNTSQTTGPAIMSIYVKNSTLTSVQSTPQTYTNITNGATLVYSTSNQTFNSVTGWKDFPFDNPFTYTGGALEVTIFWNISGVSGYPTTGSFVWKRDYISNRTIGYTSSINGSSFNSTKYTRAQTRFTYVDCLAPTNLNATNITTSSADVSWGSSNNAAGYEYVVDQSLNPPSGSGTATTGTGASISGLMLNTNYYLHVRVICGATSSSTWATYMFKTDDAYCKPPVNIFYSSLTPTSVNVLWSAMPTSDSYEYLLDTSPNPVLTSANTTATNKIYTQFSNLTPDTKYYFFVRSICLGGNDSSFWRIDSFETKPTCEAPDLQTSTNGNSLNAWWNSIPTAIGYEYQLSNFDTPPAYGTEVYDTTLSLTLPGDDVDMYLHVRTKCNSQFVFSDWSTVQVKQSTTGITVNGSKAFKVYPNPVKDHLFIEGAKDSRLTITDIKGAVLQSVKIDMNKYSVGCTGLVPGMYIINVRGANINEQVRFVKE